MPMMVQMFCIIGKRRTLGTQRATAGGRVRCGGVSELASAADELAGAGAGFFAVAADDFAADDGGEVAAALLNQAHGVGGEVVDGLGRFELEGVVVDDVDVALLADLEGAAVAESVEFGGVVGHALDDPLEGEFLAAAAVAGPVGEHEGGHGGVADDAAVRAAVGEAHGDAGVEHHLAGGVEVAVGVVEEGGEEDVLAVVLGEEVVGELERGLTGGIGLGVDGLVGVGS